MRRLKGDIKPVYINTSRSLRRQIPVVSTTKLLGVYLDRYLTWNYHTDQIASKVAKSIGLLSRISYLLPSNIRINLYYTMIHPYLAYCNLVWASNYHVDCLFT